MLKLIRNPSYYSLGWQTSNWLFDGDDPTFQGINKYPAFQLVEHTSGKFKLNVELAPGLDYPFFLDYNLTTKQLEDLLNVMNDIYGNSFPDFLLTKQKIDRILDLWE